MKGLLDPYGNTGVKLCTYIKSNMNRYKCEYKYEYKYSYTFTLPWHLRTWLASQCWCRVRGDTARRSPTASGGCCGGAESRRHFCNMKNCYLKWIWNWQWQRQEAVGRSYQLIDGAKYFPSGIQGWEDAASVGLQQDDATTWLRSRISDGCGWPKSVCLANVGGGQYPAVDMFRMILRWWIREFAI